MQGTNSFFKSKKLLYIALGLLTVVVIAGVTTFILSKVIGSNTNSDTQTTSNTADDPSLTLVNQLTKLYEQSSTDVSQGVVLGIPDVQESGTDGYKTARAEIINGEPSELLVAIFYQTPNGTWHFFTATKDQDALSCTEYATEDLANAFIGFTCKGETDEASFVEKPPETFEVIPDSFGG